MGDESIELIPGNCLLPLALDKVIQKIPIVKVES